MPALRAFAAHLRADVALMLQYRGEILLWSIWGIINPAVLYAMWSSAASGNVQGTIAGLDAAAFAAYYFNMMIVGHLTGAWDVYQMGYYVRTGELSPMLLRPVLPIWRALAANVSYKVTTLMFVIPIWAVFALLVKPRFAVEPWQVGLGLLAVLLGAALNYMLGYIVSLMAFWATKLDALAEIYFGFCMFLGGRIAPLDALPEPALTAARFLPFSWMFGFPVELLTGRIRDWEQALLGLRIQLLWFILFVVLFRVLWRIAIKRYTAVSG